MTVYQSKSNDEGVDGSRKVAEFFEQLCLAGNSVLLLPPVPQKAALCLITLYNSSVAKQLVRGAAIQLSRVESNKCDVPVSVRCCGDLVPRVLWHVS